MKLLTVKLAFSEVFTGNRCFSEIQANCSLKEHSLVLRKIKPDEERKCKIYTVSYVAFVLCHICYTLPLPLICCIRPPIDKTFKITCIMLFSFDHIRCHRVCCISSPPIDETFRMKSGRFSSFEEHLRRHFAILSI